MNLKFSIALSFLFLLLVQTVMVNAHHIPSSNDTIKTANLMMFPTTIAPTIDGVKYNVNVIAFYIPSNGLGFAPVSPLSMNSPTTCSKYAFLVITNGKAAVNNLPIGKFIYYVDGNWIVDKGAPYAFVPNAPTEQYRLGTWLALYNCDVKKRINDFMISMSFSNRSDLMPVSDIPNYFLPKPKSVPSAVSVNINELDSINELYSYESLGYWYFQWHITRQFATRLTHVSYGYPGGFGPLEVGEGFVSPAGSELLRFLRVPGSLILKYNYNAAAIGYD